MILADDFSISISAPDAPPLKLQRQEEKKTELLVMRNLRCGSSKHRFLDIKIGQKTAQAVSCPGDRGYFTWVEVYPYWFPCQK